MIHAAIRPAAVAGLFYPGATGTLDSTVRHLLDEAQPRAVRPKALIVPHAGYIYSGAIAASAYVTLLPWRRQIRRVALLGPTHRIPVRGLAASGTTMFETPLGTIPIDTTAMDMLAALPQVSINDTAHLPEHSLEVQLPFLQAVLDEFLLAPFVVGDATENEVSEVLEWLWGGEETLIVISSDLSHYHSYEDAMCRDRATVNAIMQLQTLFSHEQACGATPINGLLALARHKKLKPTLLGLCNSGDTAGDKERVVGYAAFAFEETQDAL